MTPQRLPHARSPCDVRRRGFFVDADPAQTCWVISAPQLDTARNVQFRHFHINSERHDVGLRLDVPDFHPFQDLQASKVDLVLKCLVFPTSAMFFNLIMRSKAMMLNMPDE